MYCEAYGKELLTGMFWGTGQRVHISSESVVNAKVFSKVLKIIFLPKAYCWKLCIADFLVSASLLGANCYLIICFTLPFPTYK